MAIDPHQLRVLIDAASRVAIDAPSQRLDKFIAAVLKLNPYQVNAVFPLPDKSGERALLISQITNRRLDLLREKGTIPDFVIHKVKDVPRISGLETYLKSIKVPHPLPTRVRQHRRISTWLRSIKRPANLELLAEKILAESVGAAFRTPSSRDEGFDAIGGSEFLAISSAFSAGDIESREIGPKLFVVASAKANIGKKAVLTPTHIRDLIGSVMMHRTASGKWSKEGIRHLTPVQAILVTTYSLSAPSRELCHGMGIEIWNLPELVYWICRTAPPAVFGEPTSLSFDGTEMRRWIQTPTVSRVVSTVY